MKTRAAVLDQVDTDWAITELDLDQPKTGEVLVKWVAAGLCHSDEHLRHGDTVPRYPIVGGHEGAGIVEKVGPGVTRVSVGDHIVASFLPSCGKCRWCSTGRQNLCDVGATLLEGSLLDGTFRFHRDGDDLGGFCMLGTFSERSVVSEFSCVPVLKEFDLTKVVLVGCAIPTGWGSAVYTAEVGPGETVVVYGIGGVGINAVQGSVHAGALNTVAVDPLANKREKAEELGATHSVATAEEAMELVQRLTAGVGADKAIVTVGVVDSEVVTDAFNIVSKGATVVLTGIAGPDKITIGLPGAALTLFEKTLKGSLFGSSNPLYDIPKMLNLYQKGALEIDSLITKTYTLDQINDGYKDLLEGKNIRGVILFDT